MNTSTNNSSRQSGDYSFTEELLNTLSHGIGLIVALVGLVLIVLKAQGTMEISTVSIYGGTLVFMFLASTLYHGFSRTKAQKGLKLLDHSAIYLLIAGTYTPLLMISLDGWVSIASIVFIWLMAVGGVAFKIITHNKYPKVSMATYLAMGWFSVAIAYPLYLSVAAGGLWLLLAGGLFFTLGVFFYRAKHKEYTHAIWHMFVVGGCACHFLSVYHYVL